MTIPRPPRLVDWATAAAYLGTSERHLKRLQQEHRVPYVRVGGRIRFDLNALDEWIAERSVPPMED